MPSQRHGTSPEGVVVERYVSYGRGGKGNLREHPDPLKLSCLLNRRRQTFREQSRRDNGRRERAGKKKD